jgi:ankyrin repeat protein
LQAIRSGDAAARERLQRAYRGAADPPTLRDVPHALAVEQGFESWIRLKTAAVARASGGDAARAETIRQLFTAAGRGQADRVAQLLDAHPDLVNVRAELAGNSGRRTALHYGVGHEPVARVLLARGADPNIRDDGDNAMPLHFAAERHDLNVIRLLIEHGADPVGSGDLHDLDVIGWATAFDYLDADSAVVEYLLAHGARHNILSAVAAGDVQSIRAIAERAPAAIDRRMDRTNHHRRPLHLAVVKRQPDALIALLELGADVEAEDATGLTALDQAALAGEGAMAARLMEHGAEVRLPAALALGRTADADRLRAAAPDSLRPGGRWETLIIRAAERGSAELVERLLQHGASVNVFDQPVTAVDGTGRLTPLHAAASRGNSPVVTTLMRHGASLSIRDDKYCGTPAGWANYFGYAEVRDQILQGAIDLFEVVDFDLPDRLDEVLARDPGALDRPFREYADCGTRPDQWWPEPWHTPLAWAVVKARVALVHALIDRGAARVTSPDGRRLIELAPAVDVREALGEIRES